MKSLFISLGIFLFTGPFVAVAESIPDKALNAKVFSQASQMSGPQISPDGKYLAVQVLVDGKKYIMIASRASGEFKFKPINVVGKEMSISKITWVSNERLIYVLKYQAKVGGTRYKVPASQMIAMNHDGSQSLQLRTDGGKEGRRLKHLDNSDIIHLLPDDPNHILVGRSRNRNWIQTYQRGELSDVYKINVYTGEMTLVMKAPKLPKIRMTDWYADAKGNIRFGYGNTRKGKSVMAIRGANDEEWKVLSENELFEEGKFSPLMFGKRPNEFYVLSSLASGRDVVFSFDINTGELIEKIFEHDEYDVDSIVYSQEKGKVIAAVYYDTQKQKHYFDKEYERAQRSIQKALKSDVSIVTKSRDDKHLIVKSYSDTEPGSYYYYDVVGKKMAFIGTPYPQIPADKMASKEPVQYQSRDGLTINAYLTKPKWHKTGALPTIVFPYNGQSGRFYKTYHYMVQFLASRGYAVLQPNVRGSAGYGDRFASLGRGEWGRDKQKDLQDAAYWLIDNGHSGENQICILGIGDYAGYEAIMGTIISKDVFSCAASWGGYTDIQGELKATGNWNDDSAYYQRIAGDLKKKEVKTISPVQRVKEVSIPLMLAHGDEDSWVDIKFPKKFVKKLKKSKKVYEFHEFEEAGRWYDTGKETIRFFKILEDFLYKHNPSEALKKWRTK